MQFDRALVFFNPASTHTGAALRRIGELKDILGEHNVTTVETSPEGRTANASLLEKQGGILGESTLLCIAAGDGTTNQVIEALLTSPKLNSAVRKTPILPLWGGNANDLAHMLNGAAYRTHIKDILKHGRVVPIHPLQCKMSSKGKPAETRVAACYASFGATAIAAHRLNRPTHRQSRLQALPGGRILQEIITVVSAFMEAPAFSVKEAGDIKVVYEISFYNGSRMAKVERLPARLTDEMFYLNALKDKPILFLLPIPRFIEFTHKRIAQKFLRTNASFTTQEESWAQFDGEPVHIPPNTEIQMQLSPRPFYALSTTLNSDNKK